MNAIPYYGKCLLQVNCFLNAAKVNLIYEKLKNIVRLAYIKQTTIN